MLQETKPPSHKHQQPHHNVGRKFTRVDPSRMFAIKETSPRLADHVNQWRQNHCPTWSLPLARCVESECFTQSQQVVSGENDTDFLPQRFVNTRDTMFSVTGKGREPETERPGSQSTISTRRTKPLHRAKHAQHHHHFYTWFLRDPPNLISGMHQTSFKVRTWYRPYFETSVAAGKNVICSVSWKIFYENISCDPQAVRKQVTTTPPL